MNIYKKLRVAFFPCREIYFWVKSNIIKIFPIGIVFASTREMNVEKYPQMLAVFNLEEYGNTS